MALDRRKFLKAIGLFAGATAAIPAAAATDTSVAGLDAAHLGVRPGRPDDQTLLLQRAIDQATSTRRALTLAAGVYRVSGVSLPAGAQLIGVPGATRLVATRGKPIVTASNADGVRVSGLIFDGGGQPLPTGQGLLSLANGRNVRILDCELIGSARFGIALDSIEGEVSGNTVIGAADAAMFALDSRGLRISGNRVRRAGNNGILVWRRQAGEDGTIVAENHIEDVSNRDGGDGPYGNGINVFRAGNVIVRNNRIRACVFSAVRANAASNIQIIGNHCSDLGEVALYAEFGFEGAIIAHNTVEGAGHGISVTNFNEGGRLAVVQANIVRNIAPQAHARTPSHDHGVGIHVEADTAVTGNVVEKAARVGIMVGWGRYLRDVTVTGNVVREADIGIGVSVVAGAGAALIANNLIARARSGAIIGMDHMRPATADLATEGAARPSLLAISGNQVN